MAPQICDVQDGVLRKRALAPQILEWRSRDLTLVSVHLPLLFVSIRHPPVLLIAMGSNESNRRETKATEGKRKQQKERRKQQKVRRKQQKVSERVKTGNESNRK
jgi:hypothetical protein